MAQSGIGVLLIEQFATIALGLAGQAYLIEGGQLRHHGPASELRTTRNCSAPPTSSAAAPPPHPAIPPPVVD